MQNDTNPTTTDGRTGSTVYPARRVVYSVNDIKAVMRTAGQNRRRPSERVCTVYTVVADDPRSDLGDSVYRFRTRREAEAFAAGKDHWGSPASVDEDSEVPYRLALRWGVI